MAVLLDDVIQYLNDQGLVNQTGGYTGQASFLPDSPDTVICVMEIPGGEPDHHFEFPRFQVLVRSGAWDYAAARAVIQQVFQALHNATITGYVYLFATGTPVLVGYDGKDRPVLSLSFKVMVTQ